MSRAPDTQALLQQLAKVLGEIEAEPTPQVPTQDHSLRRSESALLVVTQFLDLLPGFRGDGPGLGLTKPLWDLLVALEGIAEGIAHPMLAPRKTGKRTKTAEQQALMAWAAICLDCLIEAGASQSPASKLVAAELKSVRLSHGPQAARTGVTGTTVQNWRYQLREGEGKAPRGALVAWRKYLDVRKLGQSPQSLVDWSMSMLRRLVKDRLILQSPPKKVED